jgi:demethoxyubiquinone hydroxylase (CLK1/Coq7/Cat5 family)
MEKQAVYKTIPPLVRKQIIQAQRNEITEHRIYKRLAAKVKEQKNKKILNTIADDELRHYNIWMKYSGREVSPSHWDIFKYYWMARIFGLAFSLKIMEKGEERAQINYDEIGKEIPEALKMKEEENVHEKELLTIINSRKF